MTKRLLHAAAALATLGAASFSAQAEAKFVFPYNHPDLDWYSIESEHFVVHYPVSKKTAEEGNEHYINGEYSARRTSVESERMWPLMCGELNYFLKERIHVVILEQTDYLQGFTVPSFDWIEISANPGGYFYRMRGRGEWFSDVMIHEFAHVVSLKASGNFSEGVQGAVIGGLYNDGIRDAQTGVQFYFPDNDAWWWTEGGAEFWSNNTGYYWWTSARDQNIRMTVLQDRLLSYEEWESRIDASDWGDGERGYQQGYSMALYMRERFGDEAMARIAIEYSKGWRLNWDSVIEDTLGIDGRTLYNDWVEYVTAKYEAVEKRIQDEGQVEGFELKGAPSAWDFSGPAAVDEWERQNRREREDEREATGTWELYAQYSPDGRWYGYNNGGVNIIEYPEDAFYAFSGQRQSDPEVSERASRMRSRYGGRGTFAHGWDFVPGQDQIVITANEDSLVDKPLPYWTSMRFEADGYDWKQLWLVDLTVYTETDKGHEYETMTPGTILGKPKMRDGIREIPNTLRGTDPAVSPDGKRVVYIEYEDGGTNLVVINIDGTDKTYLTTFHDGTMFQRPDWSPDGTHVVASVFRNYQNDLYMFNVDTLESEALTFDKNESFDPYWGADGKIYFTSDPDGIYNIYAMDPETRDTWQLTNVLGGASCPSLTPEGNLVFTMFTGYGMKIWGLAGDQFMWKPSNHKFTLDMDAETVQAAWDYEEDLTWLEANTRKYKGSRAMMPTWGIPIVRYGNDSMTNWDIQAGFQVNMQDFVEKHGAWFTVLLGEDTDIGVQYYNQVWHPTFYLVARFIRVKYDLARAIDADGNYQTTQDQTIAETEMTQVYSFVAGGASYPINPRTDIFAQAFVMGVGFKGASDVQINPFSVRAMGTTGLSYSTVRARNRANPRGGIAVDLSYTHGYTDIVYAPYYGVDTDDGQKLDAYHYNTYNGRFTTHWPVHAPWGFDPLGLLGQANRHSHTLTIDAQLGIVDRNVQFNDEFRAGGRHPYWFGSGAVQPNTMFSGYPASSLGGETMAILSAAYRFPVVQDINKKVGPLYMYGLHAQVLGSAGNLWSFRAPDEPGSFYYDRFGSRVAYNEDDVRREIPFLDYSYKNSPVDPATGEIDPNYFLFDAGVELRLSSALFNRGSWDSFVRVAYGFNEIRGVGDVNGDDIITTADNGLGDALSAESELPGLRVYVGLGTGW